GHRKNTIPLRGRPFGVFTQPGSKLTGGCSLVVRAKETWAGGRPKCAQKNSRIPRRLSGLNQLTHPRFRLLQPVGHAHFAVHRRRDIKVLPSLRVIARAAMELAKAEVAVGNERAHAARLGERQRLAVVAFSVVGADCGGDVTVETEGMGLGSPSAQPA